MLEFKNVILFGCGGLLEIGIKYLNDKNINIKYLSDNNDKLWSKTFFNIEVINPQYIKNYNYPVLISSMYSKEIKKQLNSFGINHVYDISFYLYYEKNFTVSKYIENEKIELVNSFLEDKISKDVFNGLVKYRKTLNPDYIIESSYEHYFNPSVEIGLDDIIFDGGAWQGDTALKFSEKVNNSKTYAFEPESSNYKELVKNIEMNQRNSKIYPINIGLWSQESEMNFSLDDHDTGSHSLNLNRSNKQIIQVDSMDNFFHKKGLKKIDFIKLDIEGSEIEALLGAKNIISTFKPKLAISIYHKPEDLWEIPLLIKKLNPQYKLYMGHHSFSFFETVIYAI